MPRLQDIQIAWMLRGSRSPRIDPSQVHLWSVALAAAIDIALVVMGAWRVLALISSMMGNFGAVRDRQESAAAARALVGAGAGLAALTLLLVALWRRSRARFYAETIGVSPKHARAQFWVLVAGSAAIVLTAAIYC